MMESLAEAGSCSKYDSRGVLWTGEYGMFTKKSCSLTPGPLYAGSLVEIVQEAFWFCDETLGDFDSPEPDRSGCTDPWIDNLNDNTLSNLSAGEIYVLESDDLEFESSALGVLGGSLLKLNFGEIYNLEEGDATTDATIDMDTTTDADTTTVTDTTTGSSPATTTTGSSTTTTTTNITLISTTTKTTTSTTTTSTTTTVKPTTTTRNTTTTTTPTTTTTTTTTTTAGICSENDSRGEVWNAPYNEFACKNCSSSQQKADSCEAFWFCDGTLGRFNTSQPDRSGCTDPWIDDIDEDMLNSSTAFNLSETINNGLNDTDSPPLAGTILKLGELLPKVLELRRTENSSDNVDFTQNLVYSINEIFSTSVGWTEISDLEIKSKTLTYYLQALDYTGYLYAIKNNNCCDCSSEKEFEFSKIHLTSRRVDNSDDIKNAKECFNFDSDSICMSRKEKVSFFMRTYLNYRNFRSNMRP